MRKQIRSMLVMLFVLVMLVLAACTPSTPRVPEPGSEDAAYTSAANTVSAAMTRAVGTTPAGSTISSNPPIAGEPSATPFPTNAPTQLGQSTPMLSPSPRPAVTATFGPTAALELVYADNFQENRGWAEYSGDDFLLEYSVGRYRMVVDLVTGNSPVFSIRQQEYRDVAMEIDVLRFEGPTDGYYGLLCRFLDVDNYYRFVFNSKGEYDISKKSSGEFTVLASGEDPDIYKVEEKNHLKAECLGDQLALYLNGEKLLETSDTTFGMGFIGLAAGTPDRPGLNVLFDNFKLLKP